VEHFAITMLQHPFTNCGQLPRRRVNEGGTAFAHVSSLDHFVAWTEGPQHIMFVSLQKLLLFTISMQCVYSKFAWNWFITWPRNIDRRRHEVIFLRS